MRACVLAYVRARVRDAIGSMRRGAWGLMPLGLQGTRRRTSYLKLGAVGKEILAVGKWTPGWAG